MHPTLKQKFGIFRVIGILALIVIAAIVIMGKCVTLVPVNTVGLEFNSVIGGLKETPVEPGLKLHSPFTTIYEVSTNTHSLYLKETDESGNPINTAITAQTKDGQWLKVQADIQYRILPEDAYAVFSQFKSDRTDVRENLLIKLPPVTQRVIERVTTRHDVVEILSEKRAEIQEEIETELAKEYGKYSLTLQSFTLVDTDAGEAIENAIAEEAVTQQKIQTAKQVQEEQNIINETNIKKKESEAKQKIIEAEGQAEANRKLAESVTPELIQYKEAEARMLHGWVEVQGANTIIKDQE